MMLGIIIALVALGILLILIEILFVPGTTVVGIGGLLLAGIGIFLAYQAKGAAAGHLTLGISLAASVLALYVALRGRTWERLALKDQLTSRSAPSVSTLVSVGDQGIAVGRLNPVGRAQFGDEMIEVHSVSGFIDSDTEVKVLRISGNKVMVGEAAEA